MAEKRGRSSAPTDSPRKEAAQESAEEALFEAATRELAQKGNFDARNHAYYGLGAIDIMGLRLPNDITLDVIGNTFQWNNNLIAVVDGDEPGILNLYMPRTGQPGHVRAKDAAIVSRAYQYIVRLLIGAQEAHLDPQGWRIAQSAVQNADMLPTVLANDLFDGVSRLSFYPVASSPPQLWPEDQDFVESAQPLSGGGFACTALQRHQSGRHSLVRVTSKIMYNDNALRIQKMLVEHFAPYVPRVVGPDVVPFSRLDTRVVDALRRNGDCTKHKWLGPGHAHLNVSVSVMEYAEAGTLENYIKRGNDVDWTIGFRLLCFLYASQALLGFEHGDLKANNIVLTKRNGNLIPQIIDFDFAVFYALQQTAPDPNRRAGSPWTAPPEFHADPQNKQAAADRSVLGAEDVWSFGSIMLGWCAGVNHIFALWHPWVVSDYEANHGTLAARYAVIQVILHDAQLPNVWKPTHEAVIGKHHFAYTQMIARLRAIPSIQKGFFGLVLHSRPKQRINHGRLYRVLENQVFTSAIQPALREAIMMDAVRRHFPPHVGLPSTIGLEASMMQLQKLVASGYTLECSLCATKDSLFLCTQSGRVVCGFH
jgi:hypothetical protein